MKRNSIISAPVVLLRPDAVTKAATPTGAPPPFDVTHYDAQVEPDITKKTVTGNVLIRIIARADNPATVEFDCGDLSIDAVRVNGEEQKFLRREGRLNVTLSRPAKAARRCYGSLYSGTTGRRCYKI
ncbi:MAG TPA: hypothetical protein VGB76_20485 [Pyrinomonadaceae bacterium]|jgi:aminopeptidase N